MIFVGGAILTILATGAATFIYGRRISTTTVCCEESSSAPHSSELVTGFSP